MKMEIYNPAQGESLPLVNWNFEELKAQISEGLKAYEGLVYTADNIAEAKKDRANLNKLKDAIEDKRKEMKSLYLAPYNEFEKQVKELTGMIQKQTDVIDSQVKEYEESKKQEKLDEIKNIYDEKIGDLADLVPYDKLHNPKWLNKTSTLKSIAADIDEQLQGIREGLSVINDLSLPDDVALQVKAEYIKGFDLAAALLLKNKILEQKEKLAEYEARRAAQKPKKQPHSAGIATGVTNNQPSEENAADGRTEADSGIEEESKYITLDFRVRATAEQLQLLKNFLHENGIQYGRVN